MAVIEHQESAAPGDGPMQPMQSHSCQQTLVRVAALLLAHPLEMCVTHRKLTAAHPYSHEKPQGMSSGIQMLTGKERSIGVRAMLCAEFPRLMKAWCLASFLGAFAERQLLDINQRAPKTRARTTEKQKGP